MHLYRRKILAKKWLSNASDITLFLSLKVIWPNVQKDLQCMFLTPRIRKTNPNSLLHNSLHYPIFYVLKWNRPFFARFSSFFFFFFINVKKILSMWFWPLKKFILYLPIKKISQTAFTHSNSTIKSPEYVKSIQKQ